MSDTGFVANEALVTGCARRYDITEFVYSHPGGPVIMVRNTNTVLTAG